MLCFGCWLGGGEVFVVDFVDYYWYWVFEYCVELLCIFFGYGDDCCCLVYYLVFLVVVMLLVVVYEG